MKSSSAHLCMCMYFLCPWSLLLLIDFNHSESSVHATKWARSLFSKEIKTQICRHRKYTVAKWSTTYSIYFFPSNGNKRLSAHLQSCSRNNIIHELTFVALNFSFEFSRHVCKCLFQAKTGKLWNLHRFDDWNSFQLIFFSTYKIPFHVWNVGERSYECWQTHAPIHIPQFTIFLIQQSFSGILWQSLFIWMLAETS